MDKDKCENVAFIIFKSIIVFISLCIAGFLIALFCMVSKVDAELYAATSQYVGMPICQGNNDYISVNCSGSYNRYWGSYQDTNLLSQGQTTYIELTLILVGVNISSVPNVTTVLQAYDNSTGNYVTATPDRNEVKKVGPWNDGAGTYFLWSFELDSTINSNQLVFTIVLNNGTFNKMYEAKANIARSKSDNEDIIISINKQGELINQNNDKNTTIIDNSINSQGQAITGKLSDINNTLNNDNISSGRGNTIVNGISSNAGSGLAGIINTPLGVISGLLQQNTCTDIVAPLPFVNRNLTLPCLTPIYEDKFGSFFVIYQVIITGIVAYWVSINIFLKTKKMSMPDDDRIEVLDL